MNHENNHESKYNFYSFLPLIIIAGLIIAFTIGMSFYRGGWNYNEAMLDFMAGFFLVFGFFKIINLPGFVEAYSMYDIIAQQSRLYAYIYPFIEIGLGIAYLLRYQLFVANIITVIIMAIGSIGVVIELSKGREITCACLGTVFKLPMTYVTLSEDVIMGLMALYMILFL
ncbi:heavy-metal-associated domain-containing protein [Candidatus Dependentiae bacterium]|nr:heavy-metal-associated domain-containing protein [Candidatus Dependentiae bacterium]